MTGFLCILFEKKYISWNHVSDVFVFAFILLFWERNKIRNMISLLFWIIKFKGSKPFICNNYTTLISFLSQRHKSHLYLDEWVVLKMSFEFVSISLFFFNSSGLIYSAALHSTFATPKKDPHFKSFLITATSFHVINYRTSHSSKGTRDAIA